MKKNYLVSLLVLVCLTISAQAQNTNNPSLNDLLDRLDSLEKTHSADYSNLFSESERILLQEYFLQSVPNQEGRAPGDVFGVQIRDVCIEAFGSFELGGPYDFVSIVGTSTTFLGGDMDDNGNIYGVNDSTRELIRINRTSGAETTVAPITNLPNDHDITGMAWNESDSTMYAISTNDIDTILYSLDLGTGVLTNIGITGNPIGIWLAIDTDGNAFMADIDNDNFYSVNLTTGAGTLIGPFGIDISFAQDADFDRETNVLYMAAYLGAGANMFGTVDTTTGLFTSLGTIDVNCAEMGIVAIEGNNLGIDDVLLSQISIFPNPTTGTFTVKLPSEIEIHNVSLFDMLGKRTVATITNNTVDISNLSRGLYIMNMETTAGTFTQKIIKQ